MTVEDVAIVGASPAMLLEAIAAGAEGRTVVVLDGSDRPGGAWSDGEALGRSSLEMGCHYLFASPRVYRMLEDLVGVRLRRLDPQPVAVVGRRRLPIGTVQTWGRLVETVGDLDPEGVSREVRRLATYRSQRYPRDGCGGLVRDLVAALAARSAKLRLGAQVEAVDIRGDEVVLRSAERELRASSAVLNDSVQLDGVTVGDTWFPLRPWRAPKEHVLLELDRPPDVPFSYVETLGRSAARRISRADWSERPGACTIVCVELHRRAAAGLRDGEKAGLARECLVRHGLAARDTAVRRHEIQRYEVVVHNCAALARLERAAGRRLRILRTREDLGDSIRPHARRWERALTGRSR